jgi:HTH-type transcriptional regulator, sugar sensing transcriptional regulator
LTDVITLLQELGFGDYEARAYVALLQHSPLNGYEVAKRSGVPRANVYGVLQKLEERGAVVRLDTAEGARFAPIPPAELTERLQRHFEESLEATRRSLETLATPAEHAHVWNVRGYDPLIEHARSMVDTARQRLLVAVYPQDAPKLAEAITRAIARGVTVITLCLAGCPDECGSCAGHVYR